MRSSFAGAGMPGAEEMQRANWIRVQPSPSESSPRVKAACAGLGAGERSIIYLASTLSAGLVLVDEEKARRAAKTVGRRRLNRHSGTRGKAQSSCRSALRLPKSAGTGNTLRPRITEPEPWKTGTRETESVNTSETHFQVRLPIPQGA